MSPLTSVNDPLLNSLSVTAPRVLERLHLDFGFLVEHHLFPAMSPRHAREVCEVVRGMSAAADAVGYGTGVTSPSSCCACA